MSKARIIVVEDEAIIAMEIESSLRNLGYEVTSIVKTGDKAVEKAEADKPDLILMDIRIRGDKDGIETAEIIRNKFGIPVVFSTAYLDEERIERAKITMPFGYVLKPIQERDLKVTLEMALYVAKVDKERKKADEIIKEKEIQLRLIVENSTNLFYSHTTDHVLTYLSPQVVNTLGYTQEEAMIKWTELASDNPINEIGFQHTVKAIESGQPQPPYELELVHKNGRKVCVEVREAPVVENGKTTSIVGALTDITDRKLAENKLKESEEKYRSLVENSIQGMVIAQDDPLRLSYVSRPMQHICGYTPEEMMNFQPADLVELIHPSDRERFFSSFNDRLQGRSVEPQAEYKIVHKNGSIRQIGLYSSVIRYKGQKATQTVFHDITLRKLAEKALQESEEKYRTVIENANEAIIVLQGNRFEYVNPKTCELSGYTEEELFSKSFLDIIHPDDQEMIIDKYVRRQSGETADEIYTFRVIGKQNNVIWAEIKPVIIDWNGEVATLCFISNISERIKREELLKESEKKYRLLATNTLDTIWSTDVEFNMTYVNNAIYGFLGYTPEEFIGLNPSVFTPPEGLRAIQKSAELLIASYQAGEIIQDRFELQQIKKNGTVIDVEIRSNILFDDEGQMIGFQGRSIDISERKQAEKALREKEARFRMMFERSSDAVFLVDLNSGSYLDANKAAEILTGRSVSELRTLTIKDVTPYQAQERLDLCMSIKESKEIGEVVYIKPDGTERLALLSVVPLNEKEVFGIARDITEMRKTQDMIIQSEKMMSLGGLAAGMAHEINNPLGGIMQGVQNVQNRLTAELKTNRQVSEEVGISLQKLQFYLEKRGIIRMLDGIHSSGKKAAEIISNMLLFSRKSESKMAPTDLVDLMESVLDLAGKNYNLKKKYDFRNIEIVKEYDSNLPIVPCTATEIEQVLLNLLGNAAWAMANSESGKAPKITLRLRTEDEAARIEVEDNGPGIDKETKKRLFEPFYTTKPVGEGTGLGLSVSYMIITNNHQGTIAVDSELGTGTKFIIRLPLERDRLN